MYCYGKYGIYTQWRSTQPKRRKNYVVCRKIDGTREHIKRNSEAQKVKGHMFSLIYGS
jgi:hypothetical protein